MVPASKHSVPYSKFTASHPLHPTSTSHLCIPALHPTSTSHLYIPPLHPTSASHLCIPPLHPTCKALFDFRRKQSDLLVRYAAVLYHTLYHCYMLYHICSPDGSTRVDPLDEFSSAHKNHAANDELQHTQVLTGCGTEMTLAVADRVSIPRSVYCTSQLALTANSASAHSLCFCYFTLLHHSTSPTLLLRTYYSYLLFVLTALLASITC